MINIGNNESKVDFFTCEVFDSYKDDTASMEHPVFSLSTKPDFRVLVYEYNGNTIKIKPSYTGLATIFDKDILLYLASNLMSAKNSKKSISQRVQFTAYDYLVSTDRAVDGKAYVQLKEGLSRLKGTVIATNIKTNNKTIDSEFSLIDEWRIVKNDISGKAIAIEVKLSDWFYNSILGDAVLTIDKNYFKIRKPTERRLYELTRKHCGDQPTWKIKLENLKTKLGITSPLKTFRFNIKKIAEANDLPEYNIVFKDDIVIFSRKEIAKEKSRYISKQDVCKLALPGEKEIDVVNRVVKIADKNNKSVRAVVNGLIAKTEENSSNKGTGNNVKKAEVNLSKIQELKNAVNGKLK